MKLIDTKFHRYIYHKLMRVDDKDIVVKMKGLTHAIIQRSGQRYTVVGLPQREIVRHSGRFYSWPYFHGYLIDPIIVGWRWAKDFLSRK